MLKIECIVIHPSFVCFFLFFFFKTVGIRRIFFFLLSSSVTVSWQTGNYFTVYNSSITFSVIITYKYYSIHEKRPCLPKKYFQGINKEKFNLCMQSVFFFLISIIHIALYVQILIKITADITSDAHLAI